MVIFNRYYNFNMPNQLLQPCLIHFRVLCCFQSPSANKHKLTMSNGQWDFCARAFSSLTAVITIRGQRSLQDLQCWRRRQLWWLQKPILRCVESGMQRHHDLPCRREEIRNFERGQNWRESSCWGLLHWPEHWSEKLWVVIPTTWEALLLCMKFFEMRRWR